jgi:DNA-binding transcriptional LysR family regulator
MESIKFAEKLAVFVEVAQTQSFSAVARKRGMVVSSVARQINTLETELGVSLFTRSTRALTKTEAGELLFERAVRILNDLTDARSEVTSLEQGVAGLLRVSCLPAFGRHHVLPHLAALNEKYPLLNIELDLTERIVDPVVERMDLVIRVGTQPDSSLIAQRVASQRYMMCASPGYIAKRGIPRTVTDLRDHRLIDRRHSTSVRGWRELLPAEIAQQAIFALECDDCDGRRLAVMAGLGIGLMPDWSVDTEVRRGRLAEFFVQGITPQLETGIYLLRALPRPSAKVRAFSDHFIDSIGNPPTWLGLDQVRLMGQVANRRFGKRGTDPVVDTSQRGTCVATEISQLKDQSNADFFKVKQI